MSSSECSDADALVCVIHLYRKNKIAFEFRIMFGVCSGIGKFRPDKPPKFESERFERNKLRD